MSNASNEAPCQMCGAPVRIVPRRVEGGITDVAATVIPTLVCTNPQCPSKMRDGGIADVV